MKCELTCGVLLSSWVYHNIEKKCFNLKPYHRHELVPAEPVKKEKRPEWVSVACAHAVLTNRRGSTVILISLDTGSALMFSARLPHSFHTCQAVMFLSVWTLVPSLSSSSFTSCTNSLCCGNNQCNHSSLDFEFFYHPRPPNQASVVRQTDFDVTIG